MEGNSPGVVEVSIRDVHLNGLGKVAETSVRSVLQLSFEPATFRLKLTIVIVLSHRVRF